MVALVCVLAHLALSVAALTHPDTLTESNDVASFKEAAPHPESLTESKGDNSFLPAMTKTYDATEAITKAAASEFRLSPKEREEITEGEPVKGLPLGHDIVSLRPENFLSALDALKESPTFHLPSATEPIKLHTQPDPAGKLWLVAFYHPATGDKAIADMRAAANIFFALPSIRFGAVDCALFEEFCQVQDMSGVTPKARAFVGDKHGRLVPRVEVVAGQWWADGSPLKRGQQQAALVGWITSEIQAVSMPYSIKTCDSVCPHCCLHIRRKAKADNAKDPICSAVGGSSNETFPIYAQSAVQWLCPSECAAFSGCTPAKSEHRYVLASKPGRQAWQGKTDTGGGKDALVKAEARRSGVGPHGGASKDVAKLLKKPEIEAENEIATATEHAVDAAERAATKADEKAVSSSDAIDAALKAAAQVSHEDKASSTDSEVNPNGSLAAAGEEEKLDRSLHETETEQVTTLDKLPIDTEDSPDHIADEDKKEDSEAIPQGGVPKEPSFEPDGPAPGLPGTGTEGLADPTSDQDAALTIHSDEM